MPLSHLASDVCSHTSVTGRSSWRSRGAGLLHRASSSSPGRSPWSSAASQPGRRWWSQGLKMQLIKQNTSLQSIVTSTGLVGWGFFIKAVVILQTLRKSHFWRSEWEKNHSLTRSMTYIYSPQQWCYLWSNASNQAREQSETIWFFFLRYIYSDFTQSDMSANTVLSLDIHLSHRNLVLFFLQQFTFFLWGWDKTLN